MEELHETNEENENLRSILKNTNYLVEILNDQLIEFHKQINEMEIKNKINDINNNVDDGDQEDNNYMEDGEIDQNEEQKIEQQIEDDEQPAIMELRKEINGDKFIIDRNGKKIKLFDREEEEKKKRAKEDIPIIYYI